MITCKVLHLVSKPFPKRHGNIYVVSQLYRVGGRGLRNQSCGVAFTNQSLRFVLEVKSPGADWSQLLRSAGCALRRVGSLQILARLVECARRVVVSLQCLPIFVAGAFALAGQVEDFP